MNRPSPLATGVLWFGSAVAGWFLILLALDHWPGLRDLVAVATVVAAAVLFTLAALSGAFRGRWGLVALVLMLLPDLGRAQELSEPELTFITKMANDAWSGVVAGEWWAVAGVVFSLATWGWRLGIVDRFWKDSPADRFFDHPLVAFLTPGVFALGTGITGGMAGSGPFAVDVLITSTVKVWATSVFAFIAVKKTQEAFKKPAAAPPAPPAA